jgi:sulfatase-like protein
VTAVTTVDATTTVAQVGGGEPAARGRVRRVAGPVLTVLAALFVLFALIGPADIGHLAPEAFLRLPVEALVGTAVLLALPARARRVTAVALGVVLGLLTILMIIDVGFSAVLNRRFDPALDGILFGDAYDWLAASFTPAGAVVALVLAVAIIVAVPVLMTLALRRLTRLAVAHRTGTRRTVAVLTVVWVLLAGFGVTLVPGVPVASSSASALVAEHSYQIYAGVKDHGTFAGQLADDAFRDTPGSQLLTGLRGKDVIMDVIESYGRVAVQNPAVGAVLDAGTRQLAAAGYTARSGYLTSPVFGAGSWLAHGTVFSGLNVGNQQRYDTLVLTNRLTLTKAFQRAGWRTVAVMPGTTAPWHEDGFYGLDTVYDFAHLDYHGPSFSWATMPDQYTYSAFNRTEYTRPDRGPLMAEIVTVSSHAPWEPIPRLVPWDQVGDGSVFTGMAAKGDLPEAIVNMNPAQVRANYFASVEYALNALISYVQRYGRDNLVLVFFGDHQPSPIVTGQGATHDVPVTIVAHDPGVLDRISSWGWTAGLRPDPKAPSWPMESFRDRFLTAFGPAGQTTR